jgi:lysophospholipase L1-like esterase
MLLALAVPGVAAADLRFAFGRSIPGCTQIPAQTAYDAARGYGFLGTGVAPAASPGPAEFAVDVPEGNYDVTMAFGDPAAATRTTVKAGSRRLMIEKVDTAPGEFQTRTFSVNVRAPAISSGGEVAIDARDTGTPDWNGHLSFEFNGARPGVASMEIKSDPDAVTVYLAGDSTVTDQPAEPWCTWGQMLPRFFAQGVAVADYAKSGLTLFSFEHERRLDKILSIMKKGDYLFIQFGHNDQKDKSPGAGPFTTYKANLKHFVEAARQKGGIPVIVTPMERRRWLGNQPQPTLADFAEAGRQVGAEENVPVIDLNAMSLKFYAALGPENSTKAFVHYPANTFPGQDKPLKDDSHHNAYGGYELAKCVVEGIKASLPALAGGLRNDTPSFDPSRPDSPDSFAIPASPLTATQKPPGS